MEKNKECLTINSTKKQKKTINNDIHITTVFSNGGTDFQTIMEDIIIDKYNKETNK